MLQSHSAWHRYRESARSNGFARAATPTWAVYEGDAPRLLSAGAGAHVPVNFVDMDPYGSPWDAVDAFFSSNRPWPQRLVFAVNDGMRQKLQISGGWDVKCLQTVVRRHGSRLYHIYLEVRRELMEEKSAQRGYSLGGWAGYYCGHNNGMTHYVAVLDKPIVGAGSSRQTGGVS